MRHLLLSLALLFLAALGRRCQAQAAADPLAPAAWMEHLERDLLPFRSHPDALGAGGDFPAIRSATTGRP